MNKTKRAVLTAKICLGIFVTFFVGMLLIVDSAEEYVLDMLENERQFNTAYAEMLADSDQRLEYLEDVGTRLIAGEKLSKQEIIDGLIALTSTEQPETTPLGKFYVESGTRTQFLLNNASEELKDRGQTFVDVGFDYGIDPDLLVCIAFADSGLGNDLTTDYNYGNVGNNDRGDRVAYDNVTDGVAAIAEVLNNQYLG